MGVGIEKDKGFEVSVYGEKNTAGILLKFTRCFQFSLPPSPTQNMIHNYSGHKDNSQI